MYIKSHIADCMIDINKCMRPTIATSLLLVHTLCIFIQAYAGNGKWQPEYKFVPGKLFAIQLYIHHMHTCTSSADSDTVDKI